MNNSKLVRLLATLSKDEWQSLKKYLRVYNREESDHFRLFDKFSKKQNEIGTSFNLAKFKAKNFPDFSDKAFGSLQSKLYKEITEWLAIQQFKSEKYSKELALVRSFNGRGLYRNADAVANRIEVSIERSDTADLQKSAVLQKLFHSLYYSDNPVKYKHPKLLSKLIKVYAMNVQSQSRLYDIELFNWGQIKNLNHKPETDIISSFINTSQISDQERLLDEVQKVFKEDNITSFYSVSRKILNGAFKVGSELHTILTVYMISRGTLFLNLNLIEDYDIVIELNLHGLETGVLCYNGKVPLGRFHNFIAAFGVFKPYDWVDDWINNWVINVDTQNYESTKALAKAQNNFNHNRYNEISSCIAGIVYEDVYQKLRAQGLELIAEVSSGEVDFVYVDNLLSNFKRFLNRSKEKYSSKVYFSYLNLTKVVSWLMNFKHSSKKIDLSEFEYLIYRKWCSEQIKKASS